MCNKIKCSVYLLLISLVTVNCRVPFIAKENDWTKLLERDVTNITMAKTEKRVVDLDGNIQIKDVPFLVSILHKNRYECGGSIIKNDIILTAAHCLKGYNPENLKVRAGSSFNYTGGVLINVRKFIVHPDYTFTLKVCTDVIQPIRLTESGVDVATGTLMSVSGFGHENETSKFSDTLQAVVVPIVDPKDCDESYSNRRITTNMMCAGYETGGADACLYDSGGPLVHNGTQYGIVSFGRGCARASFPGVYARISTLRSWIDAQLEENAVQETKTKE